MVNGTAADIGKTVAIVGMAIDAPFKRGLVSSINGNLVYVVDAADPTSTPVAFRRHELEVVV